MKSILLSIKPKWVAKILNGEKTIEIRKTMPKCDLPITVYIYCTKDNKQGLVWDNQGKGPVNSSLFPYGKDCPERHRLVNGKVVAKFTVRKVEEIPSRKFSVYYFPYTETLDDYDLLTKSCLTTEELGKYLKNKTGYAYHIEDLVIFDKPKELSNFYKWCEPFEVNKGCRKVCWKKSLTKAPQNFIYIESEE